MSQDSVEDRISILLCTLPKYSWEKDSVFNDSLGLKTAADNIFLTIIAVKKKTKNKIKNSPEGNLKKCSEKPVKPGNGNGWLDTLGLLQAALVQ